MHNSHLTEGKTVKDRFINVNTMTNTIWPPQHIRLEDFLRGDLIVKGFSKVVSETDVLKIMVI